MIPVTRQPQRHQRYTQPVEHAARSFRTHPHEGQSEDGDRQGVQLHFAVIRVAMGQQIAGRPEGPIEVPSALLETGEHRPAEQASAGSNGYGDENSRSHRSEVRFSCNMGSRWGAERSWTSNSWQGIPKLVSFWRFYVRRACGSTWTAC